jgi:hypothetical protein
MFCANWLIHLRKFGRFRKVSIVGGASAFVGVLFNCGSLAGIQRTNTLGLLKPYLSHEPRLITLSCRHWVTIFWRAGSHSARDGNSPREVNLSGPTTGPCSILMAVLGLLTIFSSGAIRNQSDSGEAAAESIISIILTNTKLDIISQFLIVGLMA